MAGGGRSRYIRRKYFTLYEKMLYGSQLSPGEYVVYSGTDNQVTITNLTPSKTYSVRTFEFNGSASPVYNTIINTTITALPGGALPVKWASVSVQQSAQAMTIHWSTASESGVKEFIVEKLINNVFLPIGTVPASTKNAL